MGEIHEHFVLALSLVWFAGATPDFQEGKSSLNKQYLGGKSGGRPGGRFLRGRP